MLETSVVIEEILISEFLGKRVLKLDYSFEEEVEELQDKKKVKAK